MQSDAKRFNRFFHAMLERGVYFAPSAYEAGFVSAAHGEREIEETLAAARESLRARWPASACASCPAARGSPGRGS